LVIEADIYSMKWNWQKIRLITAVLALIVLSVLGFWGVDSEWRSAVSLSQQLSVFTQIAYAVLGLVAARSLLLKRKGSRIILYLWAGTLILTALTAPVVWGQQGWGAVFFAGSICAAFAAAVLWLARRAPAN
jgi:hypothetical protein